METDHEADDKIWDEKLQYDIKKGGAKISALSSTKIDKHEYLTNEEISDLSRVKEQAKFTYSSLSVQEKENYVVHIRALKQALDHGLILKKVHSVIQLNQEAWLKPYIDMNTNLRKEA